MLKSILYNSGSNVVVLFLKIALTFIMAPVLIRNLGNYDYGLWEMFGAVLGYMGMLDLGLGPAVSRYAALHRGEKDHVSQQQVFNSALVFMVLIGAMLAAAFFIWAVYFPQTIAPEGSASEKYSFLLLVLGAQLLIFFPGRVAESYLEGFQKYHIKNLVIIINSLVGSAVLYTYITPQNGLILLAGVNAIGGGIKYIVYLYFLTRPKLVGVQYRLNDFRWSKLKELWVFGSKTLLKGVSTRVETMTDSLIIGSALGPAMVPFYSIPSNLVQYVRTLAQTLSHVFMPVFSDLSSRGDNIETIRQLYFSSSKYIAALVVLLGLGICLVGPEFISLWIGGEFASHAESLIPVLVIFHCLPYLNPLGGRYLTAVNKHGIYAKWGPVCAVVNLTLSILLVDSYGILGVAFASMFVAVGIFPVYFNAVSRALGISFVGYFKGVLLPVVIPSLIAVSIYLAIDQDITSYMELLVVSVGVGLSFALSFIAFGLTKAEREKLRFIISRFKTGLGG